MSELGGARPGARLGEEVSLGNQLYLLPIYSIRPQGHVCREPYNAKTSRPGRLSRKHPSSLVGRLVPIATVHRRVLRLSEQLGACVARTHVETSGKKREADPEVLGSA